MRQFAKHLGLRSHTTYTRWVSGDSELSDEAIEKIAAGGFITSRTLIDCRFERRRG